MISAEEVQESKGWIYAVVGIISLGIVCYVDIVQCSLDIRGIDHDEISQLTEYARYVLTSGTYGEQGKLIEGIKSRFVIRNRSLELS